MQQIHWRLSGGCELVKHMPLGCMTVNITENCNHRWDANCLWKHPQLTLWAFDAVQWAGESLLKSVKRSLSGACYQRKKGESRLQVSMSIFVSAPSALFPFYTNHTVKIFKDQVVISVWTPFFESIERNKEFCPTKQPVPNPNSRKKKHCRQIEMMVSARSGWLMEPNGLMCSPSSAHSLSYRNWLHACISSPASQRKAANIRTWGLSFQSIFNRNSSASFWDGGWRLCWTNPVWLFNLWLSEEAKCATS